MLCWLQARLREKPASQNGAGDISHLPSSSITDQPDSPATRELLKLKDMLSQRDNEISILHSNFFIALLNIALGTIHPICFGYIQVQIDHINKPSLTNLVSETVTEG